MEFGGYDGSAVVQTQSALNAIQFSYAGLPVILEIIGFISVFWYKADSLIKYEESDGKKYEFIL